MNRAEYLIERLRQVGDDDALYYLRTSAADEIERLRAILEKIANADYRGNRLTCQVWAREALNQQTTTESKK